MLFVIGFILGAAVMYVAPSVAARRTAPTPPPEPDAEARRRTERAIREYRNFMTYDGTVQQDDQP